MVQAAVSEIRRLEESNSALEKEVKRWTLDNAILSEDLDALKEEFEMGEEPEPEVFTID